MYAAHLCSTNEKMSKCKGRNSEAYSNLLPVFHFTLVFMLDARLNGGANKEKDHYLVMV